MKRLVALLAAAVLTAFLSVGALAVSADAENSVRGAGGEWLPVCGAMPGGELRCRAVFAVRGDKSYTARGVFSPGVDCLSVTALRQDGQDINGSYYTVLTRREGGTETFEIHFAAGFAGEDAQLEIEYTVRLNDRAGTGAGENRCAVELIAADGAVLRGEEAAIDTGGFACFRAVAIPDSARQSNPLSGACLSLYRDRELTERIAFTKQDGAVYVACEAENCPHTRHVCLLKTPENGVVTLRGLPAGTYYLHEVRSPQGYAAAADRVEIVLGADGSVTADGAALPDGTVRIIGQSARETVKKEKESDPLAFYTKGCRVLSSVMAALLLDRRRLLG